MWDSSPSSPMMVEISKLSNGRGYGMVVARRTGTRFCQDAVNDLQSSQDGSRPVTSRALTRMNFSLGYQFDEGYHALLKSQRDANMDNAKAERLGIASLPLSESIVYHARYSLGREWDNLHKGDLFTAVVLAIRERIVDRMLATEARYQAADANFAPVLSLDGISHGAVAQ